MFLYGLRKMIARTHKDASVQIYLEWKELLKSDMTVQQAQMHTMVKESGEHAEANTIFRFLSDRMASRIRDLRAIHGPYLTEEMYDDLFKELEDYLVRFIELRTKLGAREEELYDIIVSILDLPLEK